MQNKFLFLLKFLILCNRYRFANAKALIGYNIRSVHENEFPSVICLKQISNEENNFHYLVCTGTLISTSHILTADHCFEDTGPSGLEIILGSDVRLGSRYNIWWWINFTQWTLMQNGLLSVENDIAVLKVLGFINDIPINQLSTIRPHSILYGRNADVVGCGRGNNSFINVIHQTASLTILPHDECSEIITRLFDTYVEVPEKYICSVGHPYTYVNDGDSGAPFFYHQTLIGVTIGDCPTMNEFNPDKVNIHAGVAYYNCFIDDMLNNY